MNFVVIVTDLMKKMVSSLRFSQEAKANSTASLLRGLTQSSDMVCSILQSQSTPFSAYYVPVMVLNTAGSRFAVASRNFLFNQLG